MDERPALCRRVRNRSARLEGAVCVAARARALFAFDAALAVERDDDVAVALAAFQGQLHLVSNNANHAF